MEITAADVAKLRKMTGAGMMDCKAALKDANGDFDKAKDIIREKGKLVADKRADRTATEGVVVYKINGQKGYMLCLACETDFVAKNEEFGKSAEAILDVAVSGDFADLDSLLGKVSDMVAEKSGQTGEKVELPFYARIEAPFIDAYVHTNRKLGSIIGFSKTIPAEVAHDVCMQATAMAPVSIDKGDVPKAILDKEFEIGREQARQEGKPEAMLDKIAEGKLAKYIKENTLVNQALVKNPKVTVAEFIAEADKDAKVVAYKRFSLND